jgi:MSP (Major sperm protein) domain
MVKITPSNKIVFPPASVNESVYQTVQIVNTSDTPVYYKILGDSTKTFRAFPPLGMINGKSFALVAFEFQPK